MKYVRNTPSTRPLIEGFYWARCQGSLGGRVYETVVKVYKLRAGSVLPDVVSWGGETISLDDDRLLAFAGPIPSVEEDL